MGDKKYEIKYIKKVMRAVECQMLSVVYGREVLQGCCQDCYCQGLNYGCIRNDAISINATNIGLSTKNIGISPSVALCNKFRFHIRNAYIQSLLPQR